MTSTDNNSEPSPTEETARAQFEATSDEATPSLLAEFVEFLKENKAWWLIPILLALGVIGAAVWIGGSSVAPFIYPLF